MRIVPLSLRHARAAIRMAIAGLLVASAAFAMAATVATPAGADLSNLAALPGGPGTGYLSCTGPTTCTAVSDIYPPTGTVPVYTMTDGVWSQQTQFDDSGYFQGISCSDAEDCTAVGNFDDEAGYATETGGTWGAIQTDSDFHLLNSISCSDALDCTMVGGYQTSGLGAGYPVAATEMDGTWEPAADLSGPLASSFAVALGSVSCTSPGNCQAIGGAINTNGPGAYNIFATETDGTWGDYQVDESDPFYDLTSVSCPDVNDCTAIGDENDAGDGIVMTYSAGSWSYTSTIDNANLQSVSCVDSADCTAVGLGPNNVPGNTGLAVTYYAVETGGTWASVPVRAVDGGYRSVSCTGVNDCTAIGTFDYTASNTPDVVVTDDSASVSLGDPLTFTATVTGTDAPAPTGPVTWTVTDPDAQSAPCTSTTGPVAASNVSTYTCTVTDAVAGTYQAAAAFGGDAQYAPVTGSDPPAKVPSISWPTSQTMVYGTPLIVPKATSPVPGTFRYNPTFFTLPAGMYTLSATFIPTDQVHYLAETVTMTLTVTKATPKITWGKPMPITYGTPLSATQLDAKGSASGILTYNPPAGTIVSGGTHVLSVMETPSDTNDYNSASATETLVVKQAPTATALTFTSPVTVGAENLADFSVTVTSPTGQIPTGKVTIYAGVAVCTIILNSSGQGSCAPLPGKLNAGTYNVHATYATSTDFLASASAVAPLVVQPSATTMITAPVTLKATGTNNVPFYGKLISQVTGKGITGRLVSFTFGTQTCNAVTGSTGLAKCVIAVTSPSSVTSYTATFAGSVNFTGSSATGPVT